MIKKSNNKHTSEIIKAFFHCTNKKR